MLTLIGQWLGGADQDQFAASFARFVGANGYDLAGLRTDLGPIQLPARQRRRRAALRRHRNRQLTKTTAAAAQAHGRYSPGNVGH
jgi:hypothetical protein